MKQILSLHELQLTLQTRETVWLLLIKKGSEQSECALKNYSDAIQNMDESLFCYADVHTASDIHPQFGVSTVPSLLEFKNGSVANVIKGCHQPGQFRSIFENVIFVSGNKADDKPSKNVIVYTTPTCSWCNTLKRHLDVYQVRYREVDVSKDPKAAEAMVRKSGQQGVPQTDINGQVVVGFDRDRLNRLLDIH